MHRAARIADLGVRISGCLRREVVQPMRKGRSKCSLFTTHEPLILGQPSSHIPGKAKPVFQQRGAENAGPCRSYSGGSGGSGSSGGSGGSGGGKGEGSEAGGGKPSGIYGLWAAYLSLLDRQPVATKAVSAAILNAVGDVISQLYFEDNGFDWKRTAIFSLLGLVLVGPALHFWYGALARFVPQPGTQGALLRLAGDQLAFAPPFIALFFASLLFLEGHPEDTPAKLRQDWRGAVAANWKLWIPFQFINFRFVPQHLQVLAANIVAVGWNTYLSWASHKKVTA